jgi:hypothetical protein
LSVQHRQEAEVAAAEECKREAAETAATTAKVARLVMEELAAAKAEVEAAVTTDAARAAAAELKALRASSTDSSVSTDDDRDNELMLAREAARKQAAQWAAAHPRGTVAAALTGADAPTVLREGARAAAVSLTAATAQTGADASAAGLTKIAAFTSGVTLLPRTGTMVIMGSRSLSGTSVPAVGGLPSLRPTTLSGPR